MDTKEVKNIILDDTSVVRKILEDLGMHHIQLHNNYYTFGLKDGDNPASTTLYLDNLGVKAYTREDRDIRDIIDLVIYIQTINKNVEKPNCWSAIVWLCEELGIKFNSNSNSYRPKIYENPFIKLKNNVKEIMENYKTDEVVRILQPELEEITLKTYLDWDNTEFYKDNISYQTQAEFELGLDVFSHRITIPIRDEIGRLIGIKGRRVWDTIDEYNPKYLYLKKCKKSEILFGVDKTLSYIKQKDEVIICESEKGVMQLWSYGFKNAVAVGGHDISNTQVEKIIKLDVGKVIIAFDEDVQEKVLKKEYEKLCDFVEVKCIIDLNNILNEKESPMDDPKKWEKLYNNYQMIPSENRKIEKKEEIKEWEQVTEDDFEF